MKILSECKQAVWGLVCTELLREWIGAGQSAWLPVTGESMAPFLPDRSRVLVSRAAPDRFSCGDLVVYEVEGKLICHRVLWRRFHPPNQVLLTKGDGRRMTDPWVSVTQVVGKVLTIDRNGRIVRLDTPLLRLQAVAAAALSLLAAGSNLMMRRGRRLLPLQSKRLSIHSALSGQLRDKGFQR